MEALTALDCTICELKSSRYSSVLIPQHNKFYSYLFPADPDFIADIIWIRTAHYYGGADFEEPETFFYLSMLLDLVTDLAPQWERPYFFGGFVLLIESPFKNKGLKFLEKGMQNIPDMWELWLLKGMYLLNHENDYQAAAKQIFEASKKKNAPSFLAPLSVTLAIKSGKENLIHSIVSILSQSVKDEEILKRISDKLND